MSACPFKSDLNSAFVIMSNVCKYAKSPIGDLGKLNEVQIFRIFAVSCPELAKVKKQSDEAFRPPTFYFGFLWLHFPIINFSTSFLAFFTTSSASFFSLLLSSFLLLTSFAILF